MANDANIRISFSTYLPPSDGLKEVDGTASNAMYNIAHIKAMQMLISYELD